MSYHQWAVAGRNAVAIRLSVARCAGRLQRRGSLEVASTSQLVLQRTHLQQAADHTRRRTRGRWRGRSRGGVRGCRRLRRVREGEPRVVSRDLATQSVDLSACTAKLQTDSGRPTAWLQAAYPVATEFICIMLADPCRLGLCVRGFARRNEAVCRCRGWRRWPACTRGVKTHPRRSARWSLRMLTICMAWLCVSTRNAAQLHMYSTAIKSFGRIKRSCTHQTTVRRIQHGSLPFAMRAAEHNMQLVRSKAVSS